VGVFAQQVQAVAALSQIAFQKPKHACQSILAGGLNGGGGSVAGHNCFGTLYFRNTISGNKRYCVGIIVQERG
jgi:hypothetical protein